MKVLIIFLVALNCNNYNISYTANSNNIVTNRKSNYEEKNLTNELNFSSNYINEYKISNVGAILNAQINTQNLNLTNKFYFANCYGYLVYYSPIKWEYNFPIKYSNTSYETSIDFNNINYEMLNNNSNVNLNSVYNLSNNLSSFINDFFNNSKCYIPQLLVKNCLSYNYISNFLSLDNSFNWINPNLNFKEYVPINLFKLNNSININNLFSNINFQCTKNNLFASLNLINCNKNIQYSVNLSQVDRYFANFANFYNSNTPSYSNSVNTNISISLENIANNYYYFNPNLLFSIQSINELNNNLPYTSFPSIEFNINNNLLNAIFNANISLQLINILESHFKNDSLNELINNLWTSGKFSTYVLQQILNLFQNNFSYDANTNNLSISINNDFNVNNLINLLTIMNNSNLNEANWVSSLNSYTDENIISKNINFISLYESLLNTYKNMNLEVYLEQNNKSEAIKSINYVNNKLILSSILAYQFDAPYNYVFFINKIICNLYNKEITLSTSNTYKFSIIVYNNFLKTSINTNNYLKFNNKILFYLPSLSLNENSIIWNDLLIYLDLSNSNLLNYINEFNNNMNNLNWLLNEINQNNLYYELLKIDVYINIYNDFFSNQYSLIDFLNLYNFDDDICLSSNNSLISNITNNQNQLNNKGILNISFYLNNQINFLNLIKQNYIYLNSNEINYSLYNTKLNIYFYTNNNFLYNSNNKNTKNTLNNNSYKNKGNNILLIIILVLLPFVIIILFTIWIVLKYKIKLKNSKK